MTRNKGSENIKVIVVRTYKGKPSRIRLEWVDGSFLCELNTKMAEQLESDLDFILYEHY